jgi:hypothetical protein
MGGTAVGAGRLVSDAAALEEAVRDLRAVDATSEAEAIAIVSRAESLKAALGAVQARATATFERLRTDAEKERGVPEAARGRGIAHEIGLARRESPSRAARHVTLARALVTDLTRTLRQMEDGAVGEWKASVVEKETAFLEPEKRREVDALIAEELPSLGDGQAGTLARHHAQRLDESGAAELTARNAEERGVWLRPGPVGMAHLTALLPIPEASRVRARLREAAAREVGAGRAGGRTLNQVEADTLVAWVDGGGVGEGDSSVAAGRGVDLTLVMTDETFLGGDEPGRIPGHGPIPASLARRMLTPEQAADVELRRLWIHPETGSVTKTDSRSRVLSPRLRNLVLVRDDVCATPYCGQPIVDSDHVERYADGGVTSVANSSGLCRSCNLAKEAAGWEHARDGTTLTVRTPTGQVHAADSGYLSRFDRARGGAEDPVVPRDDGAMAPTGPTDGTHPA